MKMLLDAQAWKSVRNCGIAIRGAVVDISLNYCLLQIFLALVEQQLRTVLLSRLFKLLTCLYLVT